MRAELVQTSPRRSPTRPSVRTLVVLGDSTGVGIGDPLPGGGWRGFGPLLADALGRPGDVSLANLAFTGARLAGVRDRQLPEALRLRPDAVALIVGMNDTMRSDFDVNSLSAQLGEVVGKLTDAGAVVVTVRYHDHGRVFRLPGPLYRALRRRIDALNEISDAVVVKYGARCVDLDMLAGVYLPVAWSVDRLHPSEFGHRLLAQAFAAQLAEVGYAIPGQVSLQCSGGVRQTTLDHLAWLLFKGGPWLLRRGHDLMPYAARVLLHSLIGG